MAVETRQQQPPQPLVKQETKTVCLMSHATFGHYYDGYHLPHNKAVLIEIPVADFDNESQAPVLESPLGRAIAIFPGLLEYITPEDERCVGKKATDSTRPIQAAQEAKRVETIRVCGYSKRARGHYRAHVFWPGESQSPIFYELPKAALRQLERDPQLAILSPSKPDEKGVRKFFDPPGAISGAEYLSEKRSQQKHDAADDEVYERVKKRKVEEDARRQRVAKANA
jgi:hypothetical protein